MSFSQFLLKVISLNIIQADSEGVADEQSIISALLEIGVCPEEIGLIRKVDKNNIIHVPPCFVVVVVRCCCFGIADTIFTC